MNSMFEFNLKTTKIYQAVEWLAVFKLINLLKKVFGILFILLFLVFIFISTVEGFSHNLLGASIIVLVFFIMFWWENLFFELRLKNPKLKKEIVSLLVPRNDNKKGVVLREDAKAYNIAEFLSFDVARAVSKLRKTDSSELFYFLIKHCAQLNFIFSRAVLDAKEIKQMLKKEIAQENQEDNFEKVVLGAVKVAIENGHQKIEVGDILISLAEHNKAFNQILIKYKLNTEDIKNIVWWCDSIKIKKQREKKWWEYRNLIKKGTMARSWASAYTITLDKYSRDWGVGIREKSYEEIVGHTNEIKSAERILARSKINNVLLSLS